MNQQLYSARLNLLISIIRFDFNRKIFLAKQLQRFQRVENNQLNLRRIRMLVAEIRIQLLFPSEDHRERFINI